MKILISFIIAIVLHAAFLFAGNAMFQPAEVYFQPGQSAIQMKLVSSIASPESKKSTTIENEKEDQINEEPEKLPEKSIEQLEPDNEPKQTANIKEIDLEVIDKHITDGNAESDSVPSTEIIADLMEKGVTAPTVSGVEKPKYPLSCRRKGHEGIAVLEATINKNGKCTDIRVTRSAGCEKLDKSAIKTLYRAKFIPAERFGTKITGIKKMTFKFRIEDID